MLDATPTPAAAKVVEAVMRGMAAVAPFGVARLGGRISSATVVAQLRGTPDDATHERLRQTKLLTSCSAGGLRAAATELTGLADGLRQVQALAEPLPPVPLVVISAAAPGRSDAETQGRLVMDDLHEKQAAASPLGRRVLAEHSGHLVPLDEPEVVVAAVLDTLKAAQ
jgi:pimeloyl-ACP methyl ester carboxylesterase